MADGFFTPKQGALALDSFALKKCRTCAEEKAPEEFYSNRLQCKSCHNARVQVAKRARLSDPARRAAHNEAARSARRAGGEQQRIRARENSARSRARKAALKPPRPLSPRQQAILAGSKRYFTGKPCKHGHVDFRLTSTQECVACGRLASLRHRKENIEACRQRDRDRYAADPQKQRDRMRAHNATNREAVNARARARVGDKTRAVCRAWHAKNKDKKSAYRKENKARYTAHTASRRRAVQRATPAWADFEAIAAVYAEAARKTEETGVLYSVDHYYPISGRTVCGLHVACNLRVVTHAENLAKANKMPDLV